ncbi:MAG: aminotransferase class I/II-fold pyridoxal phosphate-dependent enzyme [candidate division Zixibacteria bacterium]|nr:aminotransferase class I/II-fold pyridoxal phosphate-dependent enzyme [candidate division Zixibacteria bacterium]
MTTLQRDSLNTLDEIIELMVRKTKTTTDMIWPFADSTDVLTGLLSLYYKPGARMVAAGHVDPAVEIAADRAEVQLHETIGISPFSGDIESALDAVSSPTDMIFIANPNRITGANFSLAEVKYLAEAIPEGVLIIDEYYHDHFGISGAKLLESFSNIVILRSFAASFGIRSSDAGFIMAAPETISRINNSLPQSRVSTIIRKTIRATLVNDVALQNHLHEIHDEGLRLAKELSQIGVQCRLTATDFVLLRVKDPAGVGNSLARGRVTIENLDGYHSLNNYVKYQIQSPISNDAIISAFKRMPTELYRMKSLDRRAVKMRHDHHAPSLSENRLRTTADRTPGLSQEAPELSSDRKVALASKQPIKERL